MESQPKVHEGQEPKGGDRDDGSGDHPNAERWAPADPGGLARFIDQVARRVAGRVVVPDLDGLGAAVVGDYLRSRRR